MRKAKKCWVTEETGRYLTRNELTEAYLEADDHEAMNRKLKY
jgi:hypothetical protein